MQRPKNLRTTDPQQLTFKFCLIKQEIKLFGLCSMNQCQGSAHPLHPNLCQARSTLECAKPFAQADNCNLHNSKLICKIAREVYFHGGLRGIPQPKCRCWMIWVLEDLRRYESLGPEGFYVRRTRQGNFDHIQCRLLDETLGCLAIQSCAKDIKWIYLAFLVVVQVCTILIYHEMVHQKPLMIPRKSQCSSTVRCAVLRLPPIFCGHRGATF